MQEEIFISGRNIPGIDPHLHVWHWPIYVDLFMGGLAAGLLFFAAYYTIIGKMEKMPTTVKWASFLAPLAIIIALICLFIDLKHKPYFWRLYTTFKLESPMSFGSWVLLFITPLSMIWSFSFLRELNPHINWPWAWLDRLEQSIKIHRVKIAWALLFLAISLGIYTGILLSAFNARPLWNTALLGPLFLLYGLLSGAAVIMWMAKDKNEKRIFHRISLILIGVVLFLLVHLFLGYAAGSEVQVDAAELFIGGKFARSFWLFVVFLGLVLPGIMELLALRGVKIPLYIPAACILIGGFLFRMYMVQAGELTRYLY